MTNQTAQFPTGQSLSGLVEGMPKKRMTESWIESFMAYTEGINSQEIFRRWAAIGALAGTLERKVWIMSQQQRVYPNLYVFLVGPPGTGKNNALVPVEQMVRASLSSHHIAETSLTKAALIDRLAAATRIVRFPEEVQFNALSVFSKELGALIPQYDPDFLSALTYLYDNIIYDERRRTVHSGEPLTIENPTLTLVACTTPSYLNDTMPNAAWDQGFLARVIIAYGDISAETEKPDLNLLDETVVEDTTLERALLHDLKIIGEQYGRLAFEPLAAKEMQTWYKNGCPWNDRGDKPSHPRLVHYGTRRHMHALKLCMIAAADRGGTSISLADVTRAKYWLIDCERHMAGIFTAMESGGDAHIIRDAWHFVLTDVAKFPNGTPKTRLLEFLQARVHAPYVERVYQTMVHAQIVKEYNVGGIIVVRVVSNTFGTIRTLPKK